jgi:hypothetical protein
MAAAEQDFELAGHWFRAGAWIIPHADRAALEPQLRDLGLSAWAVDAPPPVKTHEMRLPRIGYVHSWSRTQDEGWVRAALDYYGVPYDYFADQKVAAGNLRAKYDVIIFPHVSGTPASIINGIPKTGDRPLPYRKTAETPNLGGIDSSDDIRGGMGFGGLNELGRFVADGGVLITEGATASLMAAYVVNSGITVEHPASLFARGSILRSTIADPASPIAYGYEAKDLPVYFNQDPVFQVAPESGGFGGFGGGGRGGAPDTAPSITPNAAPIHVAPLDLAAGGAAESTAGPGRGGRGGRAGGRGAGGARGGRGGATSGEERPRVVVQFGGNANDLLLSGTLAGGEELAGRAAAVDLPVGKGHLILFAIRPFWRWQTHGTYMLAFNAILNWDHLDAGRAARPPAP